MLEKERVNLETERVTFNELMEKEKVKMKMSEEKFKAEVSEKNKRFFEREFSIRKSEDKLLKLIETSEEESISSLRCANCDSLMREKKQGRGVLKRFQKEKEILAVRGNSQQRKEDKSKNGSKIFSSTNEDENEPENLGEVRSKRENSGKGKRKTAVSFKEEKKAKEKTTDDHAWVLERAFSLVTSPFPKAS